MTLLKEKIVPTGAGEVTLTWIEQSTHPADIICVGWVTHMVEARCAEELVGHLRVSYVTKRSSFAGAPDGLHFMSEHRGWCLNFNDQKDLWIHSHLHAKKTPLSSLKRAKFSCSWQNDTPTSEEMENDLCELHKLGERARKEQLRLCATPLVAYASVYNEERSEVNWRRQGIARKMYLFAAQELGSRGQVLLAGDLQTEDAKALWKSFESDPNMPTRRVRIPTHDRTRKTRLVLDCRSK
jgi:hypothetical protein